jgi:D-3-phosphoglycerate dehydrogenase / 2-oxoglutarate reductase
MGSDPVEALILDLLEWLDSAPRPYNEVMEAWRTSCPRLPVWEEVNRRGFVARQGSQGTSKLIALSPTGSAHLRKHRHAVSP